MITININTDQIRARLAGLPDVIEKATRSTLRNTVAFGSPVQKDIEKSILAAIPTANPYTSGGSAGNAGKDGVDRKSPIYVSYPPSEGALTSTVGVKRKQAAYLQFLVKGIPRDDKIIERKFNGHMVIPTRAIKLDKYGNVPKDRFLEIVQKAQTKTDDYFALTARRGKQAPGIYQRQEGKAVPLFWIVPSVDYQKQWDFFKVAEESILKRLPDAMNEAIAKRLKDYQNGK